MPVKPIRRAGILVGGGPAPGINSVISSATIKFINAGVEVLGFYDGFRWLMQGKSDHYVKLEISDVSNIHFDGGSILRTTRANPTKKKEDLERVLAGLREQRVDCLITIGGDDTCYSASKLAELSGGELQVLHVPKTIDNDLNLPHGIRTFGFATARHFGVTIVKNIMADAKTSSRWYFITAMGRKAGHLALGIGKSAGATITVIPEEFGAGKIKLTQIVDALVGSIVKRLASDRPYGVAILAEGLAERLELDELVQLGHIERDEFGHLRLSELDLGKILKNSVRQVLKAHKVDMVIVDKDIGYELRCVDPIPFDIEYTRDLGHAAAKYAIQGGTGHMITIQESGQFVPIPFADLMDPLTGKTQVRLVSVDTESYEVAREYMIRLDRQDFTDKTRLDRLAAVLGLTPAEFRERYEYLV